MANILHVRQIFIFVVFLIFSIPSYGMNLKSYREIQKAIKTADVEVRRIYETSLNAYIMGLVDGFTVIRLGNDGIIPMGDVGACIPESVTIDENLIYSAIETGVKIESLEDSYFVGTFAYLGLVKMFPCELESGTTRVKPKAPAQSTPSAPGSD